MNEITLFEDALRAAVPAQPDRALRATLVPRLAQAARAATLEAEGHATRQAGRAYGLRRSRLARLAQVCAAVALIPLVLAGLAFAGVALPAPARDAFSSLGITLPNQPSHADNSGTASEKSANGKGNDVSDAAKSGANRGPGGNSAAAHRHALAQRAKARGLAKGHTRGKAIGLTGSTPPGRLVHPTPPAHSNSSSSGGNSGSTHPAPHSPPFPPSGGSRGAGHGR